MSTKIEITSPIHISASPKDDIKLSALKNGEIVLCDDGIVGNNNGTLVKYPGIDDYSDTIDLTPAASADDVTVIVKSENGVTDTDFTIGSATASAAGVMSAADKAKLDSIGSGGTVETMDDKALRYVSLYGGCKCIVVEYDESAYPKGSKVQMYGMEQTLNGSPTALWINGNAVDQSTNDADFKKAVTAVLYVPREATTLAYYNSLCQNMTALTYVTPYITAASTGSNQPCWAMFQNASALTSVDLSHWCPLTKATNIHTMFQNASALMEIKGLSVLNTSAATSMQGMFYGCSALTSLDVSGFNTSAVTNMQSMFANCSALTSLDVSGFNTSAVTNMQSMFANCSALTSLDVSGFNTSAVTNMQGMFANCNALAEIKGLDTLDTSKVTSLEGLFNMYNSGNGPYKGAMTSIDLSTFDTTNVTTIGYMFFFYKNLEELNCDNWNLPNLTRTVSFIDSCTALTRLTLGKGFFSCTTAQTFNLSSASKWETETLHTSLITNLYDRVGNGLDTVVTIKLATATKALLTDEEKASITAKGYTIA